MAKDFEFNLSAGSVVGAAVVLISLFYLYSFETVTLSTPIAFGDEGFHAGTPRRMVENMEIPKYFQATPVYAGAYFRPPLPHLVYAGVMLLFGTSDIVTKFLTPLFSFFTALVIFLLVKRIHSKEAGLTASFLYLVTPSIITYNVLVYSEAPLVFFFSVFLYSFYRYAKERELKFLITTGITAGFVAMSKFTGLLVFPLLIILFFLTGSDWKKHMKGFAALFIIALLVGTSFQVREILSYGGLCQPRIPANNNCYVGEAPAGTATDGFAGYTQQSGTNLSLIDIGVMNYIQFGYTVTLFLLFIAGLFFGLLNKSQDLRSMAVAAIFLFGVLVLQTINARTEDSVRAAMIGVIPLVALGGVYFSELIMSLLEKRQSKLANQVMAATAVILIAFLAFYGFSISMQKISDMKSVKQFSPDYIEACKWMNDNIPKGSYTINLWGTPCQFYAPKINSVWTDLRELPDI
ncbi:MAG: glycosyltransferase family 39 protein, partial [Candidatus Aenigmatarchaeota archaeon]